MILAIETGINESDLVVLESHVVYSLSKEKTSVYFYIVQCSQTISEGLQVPIKDVIDRLVLVTIFVNAFFASLLMVLSSIGKLSHRRFSLNNKRANMGFWDPKLFLSVL